MGFSSSRPILTREGYEKVQRELDEILKVKRPAVVSRIKDAIQLGDLSENFDYHDAKREQGMLEAKIIELKAILDTATVSEGVSEDGSVGIGATVMVRDVEDGFEEEYLIVGPPESDPSAGKISYESSVGGALMGRKAGDIVSVTTPAGEFKYEIVSVS